MSQHTKIGDIAAPVGSYTAGNETKTRFRNIGTLMKTSDDRGDRFWIKLNADILHASLFALVRATDMDKGDDTFTARVFEPRDPQKPADKSAPPAEEDQAPF